MRTRSLARTAVLCATMAAVCLASANGLRAAAADDPILTPDALKKASGEEIYRHVCQGCHMSDGKGATGAATYPALAGDPRLAAPTYHVLRVLKGQGAMPPFRTALDDQQVADVVNYVRSSFGNSFKGKVTPAEVKALRGN